MIAGANARLRIVSLKQIYGVGLSENGVDHVLQSAIGHSVELQHMVLEKLAKHQLEKRTSDRFLSTISWGLLSSPRTPRERIKDWTIMSWGTGTVTQKRRLKILGESSHRRLAYC